MKEPKWISQTALELLHEQSLAIFGGAEGIRDSGLLESALARLQHLFTYKTDVELERLAASYAVGISRNHPFVDGNKRAALLALIIFLQINGQELVFESLDAIQTMLAVAGGEMNEEQLTGWISSRIRRSKKARSRTGTK